MEREVERETERRERRSEITVERERGRTEGGRHEGCIQPLSSH